MSGERLAKADRLRKRREYLRVQEAGQKVSSPCLTALALPAEEGRTRVGLTVSSKVGGAVVRNRVRRRLRELCRRRRQALPKGLDVVLIARGRAAQASFEELSRSFEEVAQKLSRSAR